MSEDKQIKNIMCRLGCTEEEAKQVIADDLAIDKGEKLFELSTEERKAETAIKRASSGERKQTAKSTIYKLDNTAGKRNKKTDEDKRFLIDTFVWALTTDIENSGDNVHAENVNIINPEREIEFVYNGRKFKVVLSVPRN